MRLFQGGMLEVTLRCALFAAWIGCLSAGSTTFADDAAARKRAASSDTGTIDSDDDGLTDWPRAQKRTTQPKPAHQKAPRVASQAARVRTPRSTRPVRQAQAIAPLANRDSRVRQVARRADESPESFDEQDLTSEVHEAVPSASGYDDSWGSQCDSGCDVGCATECCDSCCECCCCGPPGAFWVRGEYVGWWTKGMNAPPLVTQSPAGTPQQQAGVLGAPGTEVLFPTNSLFNEYRSGGRIRAGVFFGPCNRNGIEADFLALGDANENYSASCCIGGTIIGRPFENALTGLEDAELVCFPGIIEGQVSVLGSSSYVTTGVRYRHNLCCTSLDGMAPCAENINFDYMPQGDVLIDLTVGYRYARLRDGLSIIENLNSEIPNTDTQFDITDQFQTANNFHGAEIGFIYEYHRCRWSFELLGRLGLGNTHQRIRINGNTVITTNGVPQTFVGGLLAQRTNDGVYTRDKFSVIPEVNLTLGYRITNNLRATLGYTFIYWTNVARAGEQIDRVVNPNLLPPEAVPFSGPLRPAPTLANSDFWAQGFNVGLEYRF